MSAEVRNPQATEQMSGKLHAQAVNAWDEGGVLSVPEKHVVNQTGGVELGVRIGGRSKFIGASASSLRKLVLVTLRLLQENLPRRRWVQVALGCSFCSSDDKAWLCSTNAGTT